MRLLVAGLGVTVWACLLAVSALMNFKFGQQLASDPIDRIAYGLASVAGDGLKAVAPLAVAWAFASRKYLVSVAGVALFAVATAYSVASAVGFASVTRASTAGEVQADITRAEDLRVDLERVRSARDDLGRQRLSAAVAGDLAAARQSHRWASTSECTDATVPRSRAFCDRYFGLEGELATAQRAEQLDDEIQDLTGQVRYTALTGVAAAGETDPQVAALKRIFGVESEMVRSALTILVAAFVELGSGVGLLVSVSHLSLNQREEGEETSRATVCEPAAACQPLSGESDAPPSDEQWGHDRLVMEAGARVSATALYQDYVQWCFAHGRADAVTQTAFAVWLGEAGVTSKRKISGAWHYMGVRLRDASDVVVHLAERRRAQEGDRQRPQCGASVHFSLY